MFLLGLILASLLGEELSIHELLSVNFNTFEIGIVSVLVNDLSLLDNGKTFGASHHVLGIEVSTLGSANLVRILSLTHSFHLNNPVNPILGKVGELLMNEPNLIISEAVLLPVDQRLDRGKLVDEDKVWIISLEVDGVQVGEEKLVVEVLASVWLEMNVQNCTQDLDKILREVIIFF
jgi:hypothetical protein